jgi:hypothetical protein
MSDNNLTLFFNFEIRAKLSELLCFRLFLLGKFSPNVGRFRQNVGKLEEQKFGKIRTKVRRKFIAALKCVFQLRFPFNIPNIVDPP